MQLTLSDRSFQYGDGVFTTILVDSGKLVFWDLHWQRLQLALQRLGMAELIEADVRRLAEQQIQQAQQVVKLLISRGQGGRGYSPAGFAQPLVYASASPLPDYTQARQLGITLGVAALQLAVQPLLAGLKHTSRLETVLLKAEVERSGFDELVALDHLGYVTELSAANLFFQLEGRWCTPQLQRAGVAGVMRQWLLQQFEIQQADYSLAQLRQASAMFATNALMGIVPVRQFLQQPLDLQPVRLLQQAVPFLAGKMAC